VTEGSRDTDLGDIFNYNLALSYRALEPLDLILEANGVWRDKQEVEGVEDENSSGNIVYFSPGVKISLGKFMAYLSAGFPVIEDLNGVQTGTDFRLVSGIIIGL